MFSNVSAEELCPLPPRPDLEFEQERAARLIAESDGGLALDEAQFRIAQSYGFASWPKLARYFTSWELHSRKPSSGWRESHRDSNNGVRQLLLEFKNRSAMPVQPPDIIGTGAAISTYVPRFYGLGDEEIFSSTFSEAEAQLVSARRLGYNCWTELEQAAAAYVSPPPPTPEQREQMNKCSLPFALAELRDKHELLNWIRSLGIDAQLHLNNALIGAVVPLRQDTDFTRLILEFGANPNWIPWNGMSVLEHALVRHHSGESVDLIAARVEPRKNSFWIAAGLGDVDAMNSSFETNGDLSQAAHLDRPDFVALGSLELSGIGRPDASEVHVMWEAFIVAVMNSRLNTVEALLDRGLPPDYSPVWMNALHFCVNHNFEAVAILLLSRGASPDFKAWPDQQSPRGMAKWLSEHSPANKAAQLVMSHQSR